MDGVIIINKSKGYTSNDAVQMVRKIFNTKKVGHCGTLDPQATGVLPILIGQGTKISKYLVDHDKTYIATIKLGQKTDTADSEGKIIQKEIIPNFDKNEIKKVLDSFVGRQMQKPPIYSAIKKNGKKLYEYARQRTNSRNTNKANRNIQNRVNRIYRWHYYLQSKMFKRYIYKNSIRTNSRKTTHSRIYERTNKDKCK